MGADINGFVEVRKNNKWVKLETPHFTYTDGNDEMPFNWRNYAMFGFLSNVRNDSQSGYISEPKGLPLDSDYLETLKHDTIFFKETLREEIESNGKGSSFVTLKELLSFDYSKRFFDARHGVETSYSDFLSEGFFLHIEEMKQLGNPSDVRFVFWFN